MGQFGGLCHLCELSPFCFSFARYDLAELYLKLKNYEKSDKVIKLALEQEKGKHLQACYFLNRISNFDANDID